jgi:hypothetical protein
LNNADLRRSHVQLLPNNAPRPQQAAVDRSDRYPQLSRHICARTFIQIDALEQSPLTRTTRLQYPPRVNRCKILFGRTRGFVLAKLLDRARATQTGDHQITRNHIHPISYPALIAKLAQTFPAPNPCRLRQVLCLIVSEPRFQKLERTLVAAVLVSIGVIIARHVCSPPGVLCARLIVFSISVCLLPEFLASRTRRLFIDGESPGPAIIDPAHLRDSQNAALLL